jgi:lysozyme
MAPLNKEESVIIERILIEDEGVRVFPYLDCCGLPWRRCTCQSKGKLTIGVGRNLDDVGLSHSEISQLQRNDVDKLTLDLEQAFPWFQHLNTPRRIVILSMAFNMGIQGLKNFKEMIKAIERGDFDIASAEMMQSRWSQQVKSRGFRLASIMKTGHI